MSLERSDSVDAVVVREGWVVLSIHHFEPWDRPEEQLEQLRRKLGACFESAKSARYLAAFHQLPARVELVSRDTRRRSAGALRALWGGRAGLVAARTSTGSRRAWRRLPSTSPR